MRPISFELKRDACHICLQHAMPGTCPEVPVPLPMPDAPRAKQTLTNNYLGEPDARDGSPRLTAGQRSSQAWLCKDCCTVTKAEAARHMSLACLEVVHVQEHNHARCVVLWTLCLRAPEGCIIFVQILHKFPCYIRCIRLSHERELTKALIAEPSWTISACSCCQPLPIKSCDARSFMGQ